MKHLGYFDGAFFINLERRIDRRESFEQKSQEAGLSIPRFNAISLSPEDITPHPHDPEWHKKVSCTASHQECIRLAKSNDWESVLIFEDDAKFHPEFMHKALLCVEDLKQLQWDMFFFGGEPNGECPKVTDNLAKTNGIYGAHAYAIHKNFYDTILNFPKEAAIIDIIYLNYSSDKKKFYLSRELLVWQDDDKYPSDLWVKTDSEAIYRNAYNQHVR